MQNVAPKKDSNRIEKINSLIQHLISVILLPYFRAGSNGIVTVTKVQTSRDMRWVKVWVSVVGGQYENSDIAVMNTLKNNLYGIQGELNDEMQVKIVPRLSFHLDTSGRYAAKLNEIFKKIEDEHVQDEHIDQSTKNDHASDHSG